MAAKDGPPLARVELEFQGPLKVVASCNVVVDGDVVARLPVTSLGMPQRGYDEVPVWTLGIHAIHVGAKGLE